MNAPVGGSALAHIRTRQGAQAPGRVRSYFYLWLPWGATPIELKTGLDRTRCQVRAESIELNTHFTYQKIGCVQKPTRVQENRWLRQRLSHTCSGY